MKKLLNKLMNTKYGKLVSLCIAFLLPFLFWISIEFKIFVLGLTVLIIIILLMFGI